MPRAEIKLEDTNLAGYGGKDHRELKKAAAETETAWETAGKAPGLQIWRIEKFKVVPWPTQQYGQFFDGDSYIVLDTYRAMDDKGRETEKLLYDVHFWLGKFSSQDERGTAAYKTVELDDYLDDLPVQFRQTQHHESKEFLALFGGTIRLLSGGIESGFNIVKPVEYKPKLLHVNGNSRGLVRVEEVALKRESLNDGDVFVLDAGLDVWQWNGSKASVWEKRKADEVVQQIKAERQGRPKSVVLEQEDDDARFWELLGGKGEIASGDAKAFDESRFVKKPMLKAPVEEGGGVAAMAPQTEDEDWHADARKELFRVGTAGDAPSFEPIARGGDKILRSELNSRDVFLLHVVDEDKESHVYVWVGKDAGKDNVKKAMSYGEAFLKSQELADVHPVARVVEGQRLRDVGFNKAFDD